MSRELLIVIIVLASAYHLIMSGAMLCLMCRGDGFALSPVALKEFNELTWFGAIVLFTICLLLFTWVYLICFIYFLFKGKWPEEFE